MFTFVLPPLIGCHSRSFRPRGIHRLQTFSLNGKAFESIFQQPQSKARFVTAFFSPTASLRRTTGKKHRYNEWSTTAHRLATATIAAVEKHRWIEHNRWSLREEIWQGAMHFTGVFPHEFLQFFQYVIQSISFSLFLCWTGARRNQYFFATN